MTWTRSSAWSAWRAVGWRMNESRATRVVLRLFPADWRARYGEEFGALLKQTGMSIGVAFDVLLAAADAHLNLKSSPKGWPLMIQRVRRSELVVFVCWVVFAVAGAGFGWMTKDPPFTTLRDSQPPVWFAFDVVLIGAIVSAVALAVAGIPIALAIARDGMRRRRPAQLILLAVPFAAFVLWLATWLILSAVIPEVAGDAVRVAIFLAWLASFLAAAVVSVVAVGVAALNSAIDARLYRWAVNPALATVAAMVVVTVAVLGWGVALLVTQPSEFWSDDGFLSTSLPLNWGLIVAVMTGACVVAVRTVIRLRSEAAEVPA